MKITKTKTIEVSRDEIETIIFKHFSEPHIKREITFVRDSSNDGRTLHKAIITIVTHEDEIFNPS